MTKFLIIQVPLQTSPSSNKSFLEQTPLLSSNLGFSFPIFSPGWKVFSLTISTLMIFRFSSSVLTSSGWEVFYRLIPRPIFLFSLPIIGLRGFSLATWPFQTHQLSYRAKMFSVVFRFSFPVFLIRLGGFSPDSHSSFQRFPRLAELASKEKGNCNNVTLRAGAESSQSRNHVTTIIQNFTLVTFHLQRNALPSWAPT